LGYDPQQHKNIPQKVLGNCWLKSWGQRGFVNVPKTICEGPQLKDAMMPK
jgi:hypothetical protein